MTPRSCRKCRERGVPRPPLCPACFVAGLDDLAGPIRGEDRLATIRTSTQAGAILVQAGKLEPFVRLALVNDSFGLALELRPEEVQALVVALRLAWGGEG